MAEYGDYGDLYNKLNKLIETLKEAFPICEDSFFWDYDTEQSFESNNAGKVFDQARVLITLK